jgi:hypothetical protein
MVRNTHIEGSVKRLHNLAHGVTLVQPIEPTLGRVCLTCIQVIGYLKLGLQPSRTGKFDHYTFPKGHLHLQYLSKSILHIMDYTSLEAKFRSKIPYNYGTEEYNLYTTLISLLGRPRKLLVITDIEQDRDDLLAVILLSHMHSLGIIELVGCVANYRPSDKRAKFLKTVLHVLDTPEIPVAVGTDGTGGHENRTPYWHKLQN